MARSSQSHVQNAILLHLSHSPAASVSSLADALSVARPSASRAISALTAAELVAKDGRQIILTEAGRKEVRRLEQQLPAAAEKASKAVIRIVGLANEADADVRETTFQSVFQNLAAKIDGILPKPIDLGLGSFLEANQKALADAFVLKPIDLGLSSLLDVNHKAFADAFISTKPFFDIAAELRSPIDQTLASMAANYQAVFAPSSIFGPESPIFASIQESLAPLKSFLGDWFNDITAELDALELAGPMIRPIFLAAGFWPGPSTPLWLLRRIRESFDAGTLTAEEVQRLFVDAYRADDFSLLREAVEHDWSENPIYAKRMGIFVDALDAHIAGKYTLSVPALLPQIESVGSEITGIPHGSPRAVVSDAANKLDAGVFQRISRDILFAYITTLAYADTRTPAFHAHLNQQGIVIEQILQRHAILHGITLNYATEANSLRAFLMLDALSAVKVPASIV